MFQRILSTISPLLHPTNRLRWQCLLLLVTLVTALLYIGSRPGVSVVFPYLPWDKLVHALAYGGFAALAWIVLGGKSGTGAVLLAGVIGLLDEGMQYYSPGRKSHLRDIAADLIGAISVVLILKALQALASRRRVGLGHIPF